MNGVNDRELVAVVVSDLHATSREPGDKAGSWLTTRTPRTASDHPLVGLGEYLESNQVHPDLILCAGDICDQADEIALGVAWHDLASLADQVGAQLVATAGNHDLDSRLQHELDPRGVLYDLDPPFPAMSTATRDEYWAKNYCIVTGPAGKGEPPPWRVVSVNSCAFHGYTGEEGPELDHGRVSPRTSRRLRGELAKLEPANVNILLIHHHLEQLPHVDLKDHSKIRDGEQLAQLLEAESPWLVVHGHKHRARILYAHGEGSSATIFAAGSASAYPYGQVAAAGVTNQVYIVRFATPAMMDDLQLGVAAQFTSLSWMPDRGWKVGGNSDLGLPGRGGFGWRTDLKRLAKRISKVMLDRGLTQASLADLEELIPQIRYLSPAAVDALASALPKAPAPMALQRDEHGLIDKISQIVVAVEDDGDGTAG